MVNPLTCERCGRDLETDDAISIIEGVCAGCRRVEAAAYKGPTAPPTPKQGAPRLYSSASGFRGASTAQPNKTAASQPGGAAPRRERSAADLLSGSIDAAAPRRRGGATFVESSDPGRGTGVRPARRRRDLAIGVGTGLILTGVFITYWLANNREAGTAVLVEPARDLALTLSVKPATATVTVDGQALEPLDDQGRFRVAIGGREATEKWLEVSADGFYPIRRPVSVLSGIEDATIELVPMPFELAIRTEPPQAEVWINGTLRGVTPVTLTSLPDEKATLLVKREGYADLVREIAAPQTGGRLDLNLELQPASPTLLVESDPPGATIRVGGKIAGVAPLSIPVTKTDDAVTVSAALDGYEPQERKVSLAAMGPTRQVASRFSLKPAMIEVRVETQPPGGVVRVDGKEIGPSPALVKFEASQAGKLVRVEAARGTAHFGGADFTVPARSPGESLVVPMAFRGERVAFVLSPRTGTSAEYVTLLDQLSEQIHRLGGDQQFALFAATDEGVDRWPADGAATSATSGQKIRAYDMVRAVRPVKAARLTDALNAAMAVEPGSVWLFVGGAVNRAALTAFAESIAGKNVAVHLVTTTESGDGQWLASWAANQRGTYTVLGRDALPAIASGGRGED